MHIDLFYQSRKPDWEKLTKLLDRNRSDLRGISPEDVREIGLLYRSLTSDLALAQRDFPRHELTTYLNQLMARAHAIVYQSGPHDVGRLRQFIKSGFPQAYRQILPFVLLAAGLFIIPGLIAGIAAYLNPEAARWILPPEVQGVLESVEAGELWTNIPIQERPYAASFIATNNIRVSIFAFASGVLAGVVTSWLMILNGLILGGLTGVTAHYGLGFELWTFVIGHGVIELSVIMIAGGTGLMVGWSILNPGLLRRRDALYLAANRVINLVLGCIPLLMIAGAIEGFLSPAVSLHWGVKWGVGIGSGIILYRYLLFSGKKEERLTTGRDTSTPNIG